MNKPYNQLSEQDQAEFIAKLIVVIQNDSTSFYDAQKIIDNGEKLGIFNTVKIGHHAVYKEAIS